MSMNKAKVLPIPCRDVDEETVKDWFQKINEELDEFKDAVLFGNGGLECRNHISYDEKERMAEEAADTITAITSMLEAMGINEEMRQEARSVLPNSLKTELIMTANLREWRHFLKLRTSPAAHPQIREVAIPLARIMAKDMPAVFSDIEVEDDLN